MIRIQGFKDSRIRVKDLKIAKNERFGKSPIYRIAARFPKDERFGGRRARFKKGLKFLDRRSDI